MFYRYAVIYDTRDGTFLLDFCFGSYRLRRFEREIDRYYTKAEAKAKYPTVLDVT